MTVSPGQDYVPSTLQPTPAFVERLATDQFVGRDVMADETPRAALILDRGGQQFKTAKAFETFIGNTVHAVGDYLKQHHPELVTPVTLTPTGLTTLQGGLKFFPDFTVTPHPVTPETPTSLSALTSHEPGHANIATYVPSGTTTKQPHSTLKWTLNSVLYGENQNVETGN
ncbi:MAG: hypothetical protein R2857_06470 [Vampirovibrionales bacterium]